VPDHRPGGEETAAAAVEVHGIGTVGSVWLDDPVLRRPVPGLDLGAEAEPGELGELDLTRRTEGREGRNGRCAPGLWFRRSGLGRLLRRSLLCRGAAGDAADEDGGCGMVDETLPSLRNNSHELLLCWWLRRKFPLPLTGSCHVLNLPLGSQPVPESGSAERNRSSDRQSL